jgi:predicted O-methyltransferase YrrM
MMWKPSGQVMTWKDIDGWLNPAEGQVLASLAAGWTVLELGSYKGRSTVCMAASARLVVAVDWHNGDSACGHEDTAPDFLRNLTDHGVRDHVVPIIGRIEQAAPFLVSSAFELAFVDGAHDAESTESATRLALRCVAPGGVIAWHDWNYSSVREAVAACGLKPNSFRDSLAWMTINREPA